MKHLGGGHRLHMWLIGAAAVAALLLGSSLGWALALAAAACGAMLLVVLWIALSSTGQQTLGSSRIPGLGSQDHDQRTPTEH